MPIEAQFAQTVTLTDVANRVGVHPVHLARTFRRVYDTTFSDYVRDVRLDFARQQLAQSAAPLGDACVGLVLIAWAAVGTRLTDAAGHPFEDASSVG